MRIAILILCSVGAGFLICGCQARIAQPEAKGKKILLSVDFKQGQTLRYKQVSQKHVQLDFDPTHRISKAGSGSVENMEESLEMVVAFRAVKVDESGFSTVEATFEKVNPRRSSISGHGSGARDAVKYLEGKSIKLEISPSGAITDPCGFDAMVTQLGKEAFGGKIGGVKNPDMIQDFVTLERMMWDAISSIKKPAQGVAVGEKWDSVLMAPMPMPMRVACDVAYKLASVDEVNGIRIADIENKCSLSDKRLDPAIWPIPYTGSFQMRGTFGFLSGYKILSLQGSGSEKFNVTDGRVEKIEQHYETGLSAQMPFGLGGGSEKPSPNLVVKQDLSIELLAQ